MCNRSCLLFSIFLLILSVPSFLYAASVQLSWQANPEPDLQSYYVYYGTQSRNYASPIPVENGGTTYTLSGLEEGATYFFAVSAVDTAGNESGYSGEVSKQIASADNEPPTISITSPTSESTFSIGTNSISLAGTASDDLNLQQVAWSTSTGNSGIASGTDSWSIDGIALEEGTTTITVTALDEAGNSAQDTLSVTYAAAIEGLPVSTVTSSGDDGNVAVNTIDNDLSTRWSSYGSGEWIQYDLGAYYTISDVLIAFYIGDQRTADFEIFVSSDASSWNSVYKGRSSGATLQQETFSFSDALGRYVRVVGYGNSDSAWVSYTEIDIMGVATDAPDSTAPTVDILSPTQDDTLETSAQSIQLSGSAADDKGVDEVSWTLSTGSSGTASGTATWSTPQIDLQEGSNVITITAKDAAGNMGTDTLTVVYQAPDTTNPDITITSPVNTENYTAAEASITLAGTASDDQGVDTINWASSNGSSGAASGTADWTAAGIQLSEGQNVITVTATDAASNQASDSITVTYTPPDTQAPTVDITAPATSADGALQTTQGSIGITGTAHDDHEIIRVSWMSGDATGIADGTTNWNIPAVTLREGFNTITVKAEDAAGKVGSADLRIEYIVPDTTAPVVTITSPTSSDTYTSDNSAIDLVGTAGDNNEIAQIAWVSSTGKSGTASGTESWSIAGIQLTEGQNRITVTASDAAGNQATDAITVSYTAPDTTAPSVTITTPTDSGSFTSESAGIDIAGTASDDRKLESVTWTTSNGLSGTASGTASWTISGIDLAGGDTVITVTARDLAGNTSSDTLTVNYSTQDTVSPVIQVLSPTTSSWFFSRTSSVTVGGTASDNAGIAKVVWRNSNGESGTCSGTSDWQTSGISLNRWWNTITVTAFDDAGNASQQALRVFRWR